MTQVTVATGKTITVTNGNGAAVTYTAGQQPFIPSADALRFIAAGVCVAV